MDCLHLLIIKNYGMRTNNLIREIQVEDKVQWQMLYKNYARFYKVEVNNQILETVWNWLHDKNHDVNGLVYIADGEVVAFAHFRRMPRPLKGTYIGFLDDLFVDTKHRGKKIGEQLINELKKISTAKGWGLVRWLTANDNHRAKKLYDKVAQKTSWDLYELK